MAKVEGFYLGKNGVSYQQSGRGGGYKDASNGVVWMWMVHMKLLVDGGRTGRYHRSGRLWQEDRMSSEREIGELTSSNYTLQGMISKSGEGDKRYREEGRSSRSFIDNSGWGSSHDLEGRAQQRGPTIRRRGIDPDSPIEEDNIQDGAHAGSKRIRAEMMTDGEKMRRRRMRCGRESFREGRSLAIKPAHRYHVAISNTWITCE